MSTPPWSLKARALLLPSPRTSADSEGEARELRERLDHAGPPLAPEDENLLEMCARDAHDAQVVLDLSDDAAPPTARDEKLLHPLSAEPVGEARFDPRELGHECLRLVNRWTPDDPKSYRALWRELCDPKSVASRMLSDPRLPDHTVAAQRSLAAALVGARHGGRQAALLYLHIGPVQSFISTARRTHDLWVGSFALTYLVARAGEVLAERLGPDAVVSPSLAHVPLLDRLLFGRQSERIETLRSSLPNKLLAIVPADEGGTIAGEVAEAISGTWRDMADAVRKQLINSGATSATDWTSFDEQIADHLEIEAILLPWPRTRDDVRDVLHRAGLHGEGTADPAAGERLGWWLHAGEPVTAQRTGVAYGLLFDLTHRVLAAQRLTPRLGRVPPPDHRPKCALCGEREQMGRVCDEPQRQLHESREFWKQLSGKLRSRHASDDDQGQPASLQLPEGEGLCAVCLTKRFAPEAFFGREIGRLDLSWLKRVDDRPLLRFPSVESIASAPCRLWLRADDALAQARNACVRDLNALHASDSLDFDPPGNLLPRLGPVGRSDPFLRFDGEWLYEMSYQASAVWRRYFPHKKRGDYADDFNRLERRLKQAQGALGALLRTAEVSASPYYAVIALDGDNMGQWLTGQHRRMPKLGEIVRGVELKPTLASRARPLFPALHAELSRRLGALAQELHSVVDQHLGRVVYTGGDDLLAFLPLATALPCLRHIRGALQGPRFLGERVTISSGIAIAHVHDPLSRTLELARKAEKAAKDAGRDAFTVVVDKRSGAELRLTLPFAIKSGGADLADVPDVIDCFLSLLDPVGKSAGREEERWPLKSVTVAHRLEEELTALGLDDDPKRKDEQLDPTLLSAFRHRVRMLLGFEQPLDRETSRGAVLLHTLLDDQQRRVRPRDVVNLLLLAHFLLREEHGIVTRELLRKPGVGDRP